MKKITAKHFTYTIVVACGRCATEVMSDCLTKTELVRWLNRAGWKALNSLNVVCPVCAQAIEEESHDSQ